jgi:hypothetical protein
MRRLIVASLMVCIGFLLVPAQATAASDDDHAVSYGVFAQLLLRAALGYTDTIPDPVTALEKVQQLGLVPSTWEADGKLTHGELADVMLQFGIIYLPTDRDAPASEPYVAALLRRELTKLRDYLAYRMGHGFSVNHVLDLGIDRAVSPSDFD